MEEDNQILSLDCNFDGSLYATGGKDLKVHYLFNSYIYLFRYEYMMRNLKL